MLHLATTGSDFKSDKILKRCFPGKWVDPSLNPIVGGRDDVGRGARGGGHGEGARGGEGGGGGCRVAVFMHFTSARCAC